MDKRQIDKVEVKSGGKLYMDTKNEREGLHLWISGTLIYHYTDGSTEEHSIDLGENAGRARSRQIRDDIQRRLF